MLAAKTEAAVAAHTVANAFNEVAVTMYPLAVPPRVDTAPRPIDAYSKGPPLGGPLLA